MAQHAERSIPLELALGALVAAASLPLSRLFRGGGIGGVVLLTIALSLGIAWGARRLRLPSAVSFGITLLALVWYLAVSLAPDSLWALFPTVGSLERLGLLVDLGGRQIIEDVAPVTLTDQLLIYVVTGVWLTVWVCDGAALRARSPLLAIMAVVPLFAVPGTVVEGGRRWLDLGLYLTAAAIVLFLDERGRALRWGTPIGLARPGWRAWPAVRLAALAGLLAIAVQPLVPGYGAPPSFRNRTGGNRVVFNPLVAIKPTLSRAPDRVLFTVQSEEPAYYRLTSLDHFDGRLWSQRRTGAELEMTGDRIAPSSPDASSEVVQRFRIGALAGSWLPAAWEPVQLRGVEAVLDVETRSLLLDRPLNDGLEYRVVSRELDPEARTLDGPVDYDERALEDYLRLPRSVPREVREIARSVAGDQPTAFRKARALQQHLRRFTYDENVAAGHGFDTLVEFLTETKRGYCEQFAGAMAVLARALGIPSRVVIGFAGGQEVREDVYIVSTDFAHAWVEVFFPDVGWVAFEPTPRSGIAVVPPYARPNSLQSPGAEEPEPEPTEQPTDGATQEPDPATRDPDTNVRDEGGGGGALPSTAVPSIVVGALLLVATGLYAVRAFLHRRMLGRAGSPQELARLHYADFLEWCAGAGIGRRPGETPREHAARLGSRIADAREPLERLAVLAEAALWAPPNGLDPASVSRSAAEARAALAHTLRRRDRVLAAAGWGRWRAA